MNPNSGLHLVAREAGRLTSALPVSVLHTLAESVHNCNPEDWSWCKSQIVGRISQPHYRSLVASFLDSWHSQAKSVGPESVAVALLTAAHCEQTH